MIKNSPIVTLTCLLLFKVASHSNSVLIGPMFFILRVFEKERHFVSGFYTFFMMPELQRDKISRLDLPPIEVKKTNRKSRSTNLKALVKRYYNSLPFFQCSREKTVKNRNVFFHKQCQFEMLT